MNRVIRILKIKILQNRNKKNEQQLIMKNSNFHVVACKNSFLNSEHPLCISYIIYYRRIHFKTVIFTNAIHQECPQLELNDFRA